MQVFFPFNFRLLARFGLLKSHETQRKKRSDRESSPLPSVKKVDELIYLPTCVGRKEYTVHFFPELFLMPSYSFDMVFYEKIALVLSSKGKK